MNFIFGGTNDSWCDAPLGEIKYENIERSDLYCVLPAFSYFASRLKEELAGAQIFFIINTEIKPEIIDGIAAICEHYGIGSINLESIDKINGHPTEIGMSQIKEQVKKYL